MKRVERFLRGFSASLAAGKMYPVTHPQFQEVLAGAHQALSEFLKEKEELILGIIEDELVFEDHVLFQLSSLLNMMIKHAKQKNIEKMRFARGVTQEELVGFLSLLLDKGELTIDAFKDRLVREGITHIQTSGLTTPLEQKKKERLTALQRYENLLNEVAAICAQMREAFLQERGTEKVADIKFVVINILENLSRSDLETFYLARLPQNLSEAQHAIRVSLLAMSLAQQLACSRQEVVETGIAALLHELAGDRPDDPALPEPEEWPPDGLLTTEILLHFEKALGVLPVVTAYESSRACLCSNSPGKKRFPYPHIVSQITSLSCLYDRWQRSRESRADVAAEKIYQEVQTKVKGIFQNDLCETFWRIQGLWPVGTIVVLNDGRTAIVREQHVSDFRTPTVQIVGGESAEVIDLKGLAKSVSVMRALNPFYEGKAFADKI